MDSNIKLRTDAEELPIAWDSLKKKKKKGIQQLSYRKGNHVTPPSCTVRLSQEHLSVIHYPLTMRSDMAVYIPTSPALPSELCALIVHVTQCLLRAHPELTT